MDGKDEMYPQLIQHIGHSDMLVPGVGLVWGSLVMAQQPASVFYMYLKDICECTGIAISNFHATEFNGEVHLSWNGEAKGYNLYRSENPIADFNKINSTVISSTAYVDADVTPSTTYYYRITMMDENGKESEPQGVTVVHLSGTPGVHAYALDQNYPNPFNPLTRINFTLPQASSVELKVYDSAGRLVRTLVSDRKTAGKHTVLWNGKNDAGVSVPSGMYFYRMNANGKSFMKNMLLLK
jgi:hypothetical protein